MSKQKTIHAPLVSACALAMLCLFSASITAQRRPEDIAARVTPVKGIDVIVQKSPGGSMDRTTATTDDSGHFKLPILPAGRYSLKLSPPKDPMTAIRNIKGRETDPSTEDLSNCLLIVEGAQDGPTEIGWDLEKSQTIPATSPTDRALKVQGEVFFRSDGVHPVVGTVRICGFSTGRPCTPKPNIKDNERTVPPGRP